MAPYSKAAADVGMNELSKGTKKGETWGYYSGRDPPY